VVSILFAFAAAFASALTVVTQHVASTAAPRELKGWDLAPYLLRKPLWWVGTVAIGGSFIFQAIALYEGRMSVVQSILVTELVFSLLIGRVWLKRSVSFAAWASAVVTAVGLAAFLAASQPEGGHAQATPGAWVPALLTIAVITGVCALLARRGSPIRRAALYATASGIVAATLATFLKSATDTLVAGGVWSLLTHGAVYGIVIAATVSTVLTQAALHYGPLAVSQPIMSITDPIVSITLGIWLYGEHFSGSAPQIAFGVAAFVVMCIGVVCLARTAPSFASEPTPAS
jgi:drug/metabolite transporter (DMT)-like permease